ncbi:MAG: sigma-54-dependent Fis family transcriptional regulator [Acidobacteria bacterium]|nr:sigma-54-dependent Fis family transcriptional regulator [Acidobacteriota bacterium]
MSSPSTGETVKRVLLVDADEAFGNVLQEVLGESGYSIRQVLTPEQAIAEISSTDADAILLNLASHDQSQRYLLRMASELPLAPPVITFGWTSQVASALQLFRDGAVDFLEQPLDVQELRFAINRACRRMAMSRELAAAQQMLRGQRVEGLLGSSAAMSRVNDVIHKVAGVFTTVLVTGESGTGKGLVAKAIHDLSPRATKPFVAFSVCSFPESLIDDELFGHERGAFTGANQARRGRFEEANGGTIFIDEIGDLALPLQAKLLRALQERTVSRLGSNLSHPIDVRVISATNRNLEQMVREGTFREDLYFRISVVKIAMPPLRERSDDIPLLAEYFLRRFAKLHKKHCRSMTPGFMGALTRHSWPGNVRELQNVIERSVVLGNGHERLGINDLPPELEGLSISDELPKGSFHDAVRNFKRELVRVALVMHKGNKLKAARELGISRCYLHRLLNQLDVFEGLDEAEAAVEPEPEGAEVASAAHVDEDAASSVAAAKGFRSIVSIA